MVSAQIKSKSTMLSKIHSNYFHLKCKNPKVVFQPLDCSRAYFFVGVMEEEVNLAEVY
jgi:hypothetical protein